MTRPKDPNPPDKPSEVPRGNHTVPLPVSPKSGPEAQAWLEAIIRASVQGEVDAFGELYQLYADNIYRYFFYRVRVDHEAQDLTAQVFLNAWKAIGRYRQDEVPFLVWLYAISRNLLINHYRRNRQGEAAPLGEGVAEQVADETEEANPVGRLLRQAQNQELARAFEQLNEEQQQVIYYRFVENWSHAEVARQMKKSEGAVRATQFRALESLRRILSTGEVNLG